MVTAQCSSILTLPPAEIHPGAPEYAVGIVVLQRAEQNRERVLAYVDRRLSLAAVLHN